MDEHAILWPYGRGEVGDFYYARYGHPTIDAAEAALGALDGGTALLFPSGTGAATALALSLLKPGDTIALAAGAYFGTGKLFEALEPWGLRHVEFDQTGPPPEGVQLVWLEAPSNPMLTMPDFAAAAAHPAPVLVDATVATPVGLRPLEHGADFVLHSVTKYLGGHDDVLLGTIVCRDPEATEALRAFRSRRGCCSAACGRSRYGYAARSSRRRSSRTASPAIRRSRPSATPASAASSRSTSPTPRRYGGWRRRPGS